MHTHDSVGPDGTTQDKGGDCAPDVAAKSPPDAMTLRAPPPPVRRLNRRVLAFGAGTLSAAVLGATIWSLQTSPRVRGGGVELHNVERVARADGLERLPRDYAGIPVAPAFAPPVLGEPLPGDLGAAMVKAPPSSAMPGGVPGEDAAQAARLAADEAARSPVFFQRSSAARSPSARTSAPGTLEEGGTGVATDVMQRLDPRLASAPMVESRDAVPGARAALAAPHPASEKERFAAGRLAGEPEPTSRHPAALELPASPYQVMAGAIIPAALVTGINSDLPGQVLASVTQPVYDTATGRHLLIPQGSRLIGRYDSKVAFGQRRVLLVWTRLILPDASSIALDQLPGIDSSGYAGLEDGVDWHWDRILSAAALSTLLGVGAELAAPQSQIQQGDGRVVIALRDGLQSTLNEVGQDLTRRSVSVQPTLTVRPGFAMSVMVNKDLILRPYQPLFFKRSKP